MGNITGILQKRSEEYQIFERNMYSALKKLQ